MQNVNKTLFAKIFFT